MKIAYTDCFSGISGDMFLAALIDAGLDELLLRRELERRMVEKGYDFEWNDILHDLASVKDVTAEISGKTVIFRSEMKGCAGKVFQAVGVAVPPAVRFV